MKKVIRLINKGWFNNDPGNGEFDGKKYKYVLKNSDNNFFQPILNDVNEYFKINEIKWRERLDPSGLALSPQIACLNHLFYLRNDKEAVLSVLSSFSQNFINVLPVKTDKYKSAYISFEQVSDNDLLFEGKPIRGSICTSIDAFIYALHKNGSKWIIPIEWKYAESYGNNDKGNGATGEIRHKRYDELIYRSSQLIYDRSNSNTCCYYYDPFYQLMRQTLWAEQMINNNGSETISADNYLHLNIVPYRNTDLLDKIYSCSKKDMATTWRSCIADQSKYKIISPEILLGNIGPKYDDLKQYLSERYWNE